MNRKTLWLLLPVAAIAAGGFALARTEAPADLDYGLSRVSDHGLYSVTLAPQVDPVPLGKLHSWTVAVATPHGEPAEAEVVFSGGMPQHGHGLPSAPRVMGKDADGRVVIGGVRFNMPGWWELKIDLDGAAGEDSATFNIAL